MKPSYEAVYEGGVLRPLEPLPLRENERVSVTWLPLSEAADLAPAPEPSFWIDADALAWADAQCENPLPLEEVRHRMSKIRGSLADSVISERGNY